MGKKKMMTAVAGLGLATMLATAAPAHAYVMAGPFGSLTSCQSSRSAYIKDGGFTWIGACYKYGNYYYFNYEG